MMAAGPVVGAVLILCVVAVAAYQHGRRHGRIRMPASLVAELRDHKIACVGEPAERVALELALLCEADDTRDPST
jgi:hypothetical protein